MVEEREAKDAEEAVAATKVQSLARAKSAKAEVKALALAKEEEEEAKAAAARAVQAALAEAGEQEPPALAEVAPADSAPPAGPYSVGITKTDGRWQVRINRGGQPATAAAQPYKVGITKDDDGKWQVGITRDRKPAAEAAEAAVPIAAVPSDSSAGSNPKTAI